MFAPVALHRAQPTGPPTTLLVVEVLRRDYACLYKDRSRSQVIFTLASVAWSFASWPFRLVQDRLVGMRVDFQRQVALMHVCPSLKATFTNLAVQPASVPSRC